jgi:hypothetical protein
MEVYESGHENENPATTPPLLEEPVSPHPETRINRFLHGATPTAQALQPSLLPVLSGRLRKSVRLTPHRTHI